VANDSNDAVMGTFNGLPEGKVFGAVLGGANVDFQISYQGGDGNDVVLTATNAPPTLDALPDLTIQEDAPLQTIGLSGITAEDTPLAISFGTLLANDLKGPANESNQNLSITAVGSAVGGTVNISGGFVIFTPTADYNGPASFVYTLTDDGTTNGVADPKTSTA